MNQTKKDVYFNAQQVRVGHSARDLVAFGRSLGWQFPVMGHAPIPSPAP